MYLPSLNVLTLIFNDFGGSEYTFPQSNDEQLVRPDLCFAEQFEVGYTPTRNWLT